MRIDEDLDEVAERPDEPAEHAASPKTFLDKMRRGCEYASQEKSEN
jgi:hypothetical protein